MAQVQVPVQSHSLYVGDLHPTVTEDQIIDHFKQVAPVLSVRLCRDRSTQTTLGYAYVNYSSSENAARALDFLNFTPLNGKPIRIMYSNRDPSTRKSGTTNVFVKNLDKSIDNKALQGTFQAYGRILSCKVAVDESRQSKGHGFVQFESEESARYAIEELNGMLFNEKQVYVGPFVKKQERGQTIGETNKFNNVFVKNLSQGTTDEDLKTYFGEYGILTSAVVMRNSEGKSKGFGFANFENADDAAKAVRCLNGKNVDGKDWFVGKALKKSEREAELKGRPEPLLEESIEKQQGANLYLKNLDDVIDDVKLRDLFSPFGTITSCKVMRDSKGHSKCSGFVAYSSAEEASQAITKMNGKIIIRKPLYVAVAQRKEERKQQLQAQFSQQIRNPVSMQPPIPARVPVYQPPTPAFSQPMFYGQGPPQLMPPQAPGFMYQQQFVPGMRPAHAPMPKMQAQQHQSPAGRRGRVGPIQQPQQQLSLMQQQMLTYAGGQVIRYPPARNISDMSMHRGMPPVPMDMGGVPVCAADTPMPQPPLIETLASALANASAEHKTAMLGKSLYPLVDHLEHDHAAKITGMLLEMDQPDVLHLLESPEALKEKVAEAMEALTNSAQAHNAPVDKLASLYLDEPLVS